MPPVDFSMTSALQLGAMGLLGWFMWYTISKAQPKLIDTFKEELKAQREVHVEQDKRREDAFTKTLDGQRKDFREEVALLRVSFEKLNLNLIQPSHASKLSSDKGE